MKANGTFAEVINRTRDHGLVAPDAAATLHRLRDIRNEAAHGDERFDLEAWQPHVQEIVATTYPKVVATDVGAKQDFRRFALLAAVSLRVCAARPADPALPPVSFRGIVRALKRNMVLFLAVIAVVVVVLMLVHERQPMAGPASRADAVRAPRGRECRGRRCQPTPQDEEEATHRELSAV